MAGMAVMTNVRAASPKMNKPNPISKPARFLDAAEASSPDTVAVHVNCLRPRQGPALCLVDSGSTSLFCKGELQRSCPASWGLQLRKLDQRSSK